MAATPQVLWSFGSFNVGNALVYQGGDSTSTVVIPYSQEQYDVGGWHSSGDNSKLTVPAGVSLCRVICQAIANGGQENSVQILLDGAQGYGLGYSDTTTVPLDIVANNICGAIQPVSVGQYFQAINGAISIANQGAWFFAEAITTNPARALVRKNATQAISVSTTTELEFQVEVYDTGGFFNSGSSATDFVIPSDGYYRVIGNVVTDTGSFAQSVLSTLLDGVLAVGCVIRDSDSVDFERVNVASAPIFCTTGQTFSLAYFSSTALTLPVNVNTWFAIEAVPSLAGCLVYKNATQVIAATTFTAVDFAAEAYDTNGAHDNSTNPSRITVPSGFTQARAAFSIRGASATGELVCEVRLDGAYSTYGLPKHETETAGTDSCSAVGAWITVTPGQYFELWVYSQPGQTLPVENVTWLAVEFR